MVQLGLEFMCRRALAASPCTKVPSPLDPASEADARSHRALRHILRPVALGCTQLHQVALILKGPASDRHRPAAIPTLPVHILLWAYPTVCPIFPLKLINSLIHKPANSGLWHSPCCHISLGRLARGPNGLAPAARDYFSPLPAQSHYSSRSPRANETDALCFRKTKLPPPALLGAGSPRPRPATRAAAPPVRAARFNQSNSK
jgi:hypothetical protein